MSHRCRGIPANRPNCRAVLLNCAVDSVSIKPTYRKPSVSLSLDGLIFSILHVLGDECIGVRLLNAVEVHVSECPDVFKIDSSQASYSD